jgi:hypothetical protein
MVMSPTLSPTPKYISHRTILLGAVAELLEAETWTGTSPEDAFAFCENPLQSRAAGGQI